MRKIQFLKKNMLLNSAVTLMVLSLLTSANAGTYTLAQNSHVGFHIESMGVNIVKAQFSKVQSSLNFDVKAPQNASTSFVMDVNSLSVNKPSLKNMIMGQDLFYAAKYKTVSFKSTVFQPLGGHHYNIQGYLTLRGVTRPVTFTATIKPVVADASVMDFKSSTTIKRSDFGMKKAVGGVGEKVSIDVSGQWKAQ
ncbi:YceI family protein [Acinetobacter chinensis]|uniref:YceI family protein n=2 Tax=Acinetobacter chinensis TaxID=2004650 RepID=A0A3B7LV79_9GAMM|nr:YceI family protein [Acinetobacter chinensis]